ncbi:MAG: hypothetical protein NT069_05385 [Planctomycetota bacterium]|nr:hypothetical protein [Planctomycetota bacterium]
MRSSNDVHSKEGDPFPHKIVIARLIEYPRDNCVRLRPNGERLISSRLAEKIHVDDRESAPDWPARASTPILNGSGIFAGREESLNQPALECVFVLPGNDGPRFSEIDNARELAGTDGNRPRAETPADFLNRTRRATVRKVELQRAIRSAERDSMERGHTRIRSEGLRTGSGRGKRTQGETLGSIVPPFMNGSAGGTHSRATRPDQLVSVDGSLETGFFIN